MEEVDLDVSWYLLYYVCGACVAEEVVEEEEEEQYKETTSSGGYYAEGGSNTMSLNADIYQGAYDGDYGRMSCATMAYR
eukprot:2178737-Ditylum_brightwellii.AAC.1